MAARSVSVTLFEVEHSILARSASKGIAVFYRRTSVSRFENLNSLAGASGLYFVDKRPLVVINVATSKRVSEEV